MHIIKDNVWCSCSPCPHGHHHSKTKYSVTFEFQDSISLSLPNAIDIILKDPRANCVQKADDGWIDLEFHFSLSFASFSHSNPSLSVCLLCVLPVGRAIASPWGTATHPTAARASLGCARNRRAFR